MQDQDEIRPTSSPGPNSPNKRIVELANVLYQVLYQHNPEIVEGIEGLIEYFVEEVWKQGLIQQLRMKEDEKTRLADDEIASRVCDIVKDDFLTFSICESEKHCLEMCNEITKQHMRTLSPSHATHFPSLDPEENSQEGPQKKAFHENRGQYTWSNDLSTVPFRLSPINPS
ncbi:10703_t:CDS:2 [Paraglomus brasilianum]|uniref:10703_t:CDS:1 n=1 Tax=Paraglomus brasilianum TaxID=144538 RepID=A0A9N8VQ43_9GLOM|nr:10703_t:CDS:2 [Paraglomus brasilianum]